MDNDEKMNEAFDSNEYPEGFDSQQVEAFCEKSRAEAEEVLKDPGKMEHLFQRLE